MNQRKQPKIVTYMSALYDVMGTQATEVQGANVWQGKLIETCTSVGIPTGYYKKVVDALRTLGSIEIVTRGRRGSNPTMIILHHPPTLEGYEEAIVKSGFDALTPTANLDRLAADVRDIQQRLGGFDWLDMFRNLDDRVKALEALITKDKA